MLLVFVLFTILVSCPSHSSAGGSAGGTLSLLVAMAACTAPGSMIGSLNAAYF